MSLNPNFRYADGLSLRDIQAANADCKPISAADRHRLVEATKSPTREKAAETLGKIRFDLFSTPEPERADFIGPPDKFVATMLRTIAEEKIDRLDEFRAQECNEVGSQTVIQYREWSNEWRVRTQILGTVGSPPPSHAGQRISKLLSQGGARKIADSCEFMAMMHGGFKTFVTGTFDEKARARIASGETSVQREATRALDALSKMYRRGWFMKDGTEVAGYSEALAYCWVVEVPKNESGEDNPHIHMLIDWEVPYVQFREWSQRIESIWGNGYFHLEKIDDPLCAGAYMAKAAGYLTKAAGMSDQGVVAGNRYAISKNARAPAWATLGTYQLGIMGMLIREVYDSISSRHAEKFMERNRLRVQRDQIRERAKVVQHASNTNRYPLWAKQTLEDIGARLTAVREQIKRLPVRASKYQLVIKGRDAFERFIAWAAAHGWHWRERPPSHWLHQVREQLFERQRARNASHTFELIAWVNEKEEQRNSAMDFSAWNEWESFNAC